MLETFLRVQERQGRLKGDLNWIQRTGLMWIMGRDLDDDVAIERMRAESFALAANPTTSPKYLEHLMSLHDDSESEDELDDDEVEWLTPSSVDEVTDVLQNLGLAIPQT
jgi:hypothetical protein